MSLDGGRPFALTSLGRGSGDWQTKWHLTLSIFLLTPCAFCLQIG